MDSKQRGPWAKVKNGLVTVPIYRIENRGYTEFPGDLAGFREEAPPIV